MRQAYLILEDVLRLVRPDQITVGHRADLAAFKEEVSCFLQAQYKFPQDRVDVPFVAGAQVHGTEMALAFDLDLFLPFCFGFQGGTGGMKAEVTQRLLHHFTPMGVAVRSQRVSVGLRKLVGMHTLYINVVPGMETAPHAYDAASTDEARHNLLLEDSDVAASHLTNVLRHERLLHAHIPAYADTLRLLKAWRYKMDHPITSFALELIVYHAAQAKPQATKQSPTASAEVQRLRQVLQWAIPFLEKDGALLDIGTDTPWPDYLLPLKKKQLAAQWKKLLTALEGGNYDPKHLRSFFP
jgi:hypothetical protein